MSCRSIRQRGVTSCGCGCPKSCLLMAKGGERRSFGKANLGRPGLACMSKQSASFVLQMLCPRASLPHFVQRTKKHSGGQTISPRPMEERKQRVETALAAPSRARTFSMTATIVLRIAQIKARSPSRTTRMGQQPSLREITSTHLRASLATSTSAGKRRGEIQERISSTQMGPFRGHRS